MCIRDRSSGSFATLPRPKSLNKLARKKEHQRIIDENHALLKRITEKRSRYNVIQRESEPNKLKAFVGISVSYGQLPGIQQSKKAGKVLQMMKSVAQSIIFVYTLAPTGAKYAIGSEQRVLIRKKKIIDSKLYNVEIALQRGVMKFCATGPDIIAITIPQNKSIPSANF
eukprot:TRINITY_DN16319_c0_g1_i1.p1 TRINITY_DN16319_c0_g1~~TRINITY_DN16319_c0_g1_i1.p1  ORF type:complete len:169 (-),score=38.59 TRINITY_DN16319_c0_g1_i1:287-793(-)